MKRANLLHKLVFGLFPMAGSVHCLFYICSPFNIDTTFLRLGLEVDPVIQGIEMSEFDNSLRAGSPGKVLCD